MATRDRRQDRRAAARSRGDADLLPLRAAPLQPRRLFRRLGRAELYLAGVAGAARRHRSGHSVGLSQSCDGAPGSAGARLPQFRAANQRAGDMVVPALRRVGGAGHRDRHRRHWCDRHPPIGHGRGPAERAVAGDDAAALGAARSRLLDADDLGPAPGRNEPHAVRPISTSPPAAPASIHRRLPNSPAPGRIFSRDWCRECWS